MNDSFFQKAKKVTEKLEEAGFEAYIVGGAVRDGLLNKKVNDFDITTRASCENIKEIFSHTVNVAIKHGTVLAFYEGQNYEITSYRGNGLIEDLRLRDFTINAMALTNTGEIIDPYFGQEDLKNGLIRGVEDPRNRFIEDPLRILRAFRFVSQYGFSVEETTYQAVLSEKHRLQQVAIERIASEFEKFCLGNYVEKALSRFNSCAVGETIPEFNQLNKALANEKLSASLSSLTNMTEVWCLLLILADIHKREAFLRMWKQSKKVIREVENILQRIPRLLKQGFEEEDLYFLGIEKIEKAERVRAVLKDEKARIEDVKSRFYLLPITSKGQLAINGSDIQKLLSSEERKDRIGTLISFIEVAVVKREVVNEKAAIIRWLREKGLVNA